MHTIIKASLLLIGVLLFLSFAKDNAALPRFEPTYTNDGQLKFPEHYREWVYVTSGFDMAYNPPMQMGDQHTFDNVFVNPEAYQTFVQTGTWPAKTMFVLEFRGALGKGSINQKGSFQSGVTGVEVHMKDSNGKWGFYSFDEGKTAKMIPMTADCYSCHAAHGAVDNTFVQFYPTLLPIATSKGTLTSAYKQESASVRPSSK